MCHSVYKQADCPCLALNILHASTSHPSSYPVLQGCLRHAIFQGSFVTPMSPDRTAAIALSHHSFLLFFIYLFFLNMLSRPPRTLSPQPCFFCILALSSCECDSCFLVGRTQYSICAISVHVAFHIVVDNRQWSIIDELHQSLAMSLCKFRFQTTTWNAQRSLANSVLVVQNTCRIDVMLKYIGNEFDNVLTYLRYSHVHSLDSYSHFYSKLCQESYPRHYCLFFL